MKNLVVILLILNLCLSCKNQKESPNDLIVEETTSSKYGCVPPVTDAKWYDGNNIAPLLKGYDVIDYPISTKNTLVQKYFNQGMALAYAFNHAEAARSFYYATKLDPTCAMAFWGFAYVLGPNYNAGMEPDNYERAFAAIKKADSLSYLASDKEKQLIKAMTLRYAAEPP